MATFDDFEDIDAWQKARELTRMLYHESSHGAIAKDFGLKAQLRKSAVSIMSNIAEGFERSSPAQFIYFLKVAKGSAGELRSQLVVAHDVGFVDTCVYDQLRGRTIEISRMINGLIGYLQRRSKPPPGNNFITSQLLNFTTYVAQCF